MNGLVEWWEAGATVLSLLSLTRKFQRKYASTCTYIIFEHQGTLAYSTVFIAEKKVLHQNAYIRHYVINLLMVVARFMRMRWDGSHFWPWIKLGLKGITYRVFQTHKSGYNVITSRFITDATYTLTVRKCNENISTHTLHTDLCSATTRTLTTWHCPHSPAALLCAVQQSTDISWPQQQTLRTDRRTVAGQMHRPCST